jgi:hypothetical protein
MSSPEEYELIATLYYSVLENKEFNIQIVNYETTPLDTAYAFITSLYTNPESPLGFGPLGNDFNISYTGVRTPLDNTNSAITKRSFNETFTVNVPTGSLVANAVYYDNGSDFRTIVDETVFTVNGGRGLFNDAAIAVIKFDNTGEIFGYAGSRRIEVYKLK